jgi:uncharacterized membrane protein
MKITIDTEKQHKKVNTSTSNSKEGMSYKEIVFKSTMYPFLIPFKIGAIILQSMYFFAGWLIIAVGYFCSVAALAVGICAMIVGISNSMNGLGALLLGIGSGLFFFGMAAPFFYGTKIMMSKFMEMGKVLKEAKKREKEEKNNGKDE